MTYCCKEFAEKAGEYQNPVAGGLYPVALRPTAQFEKEEDGEGWNVFGCCGGGCFVIVGMKFCPYCGTKLEEDHSS